MYAIRSRQAAAGSVNGVEAGCRERAAPVAHRRAAPITFNPMPPLLPMRAARQNIASYVHLHGAVMTRFGEPMEMIEPAALCRIIRTALETTHEGRLERAETVVRAIALSIITAERGPLPVPRTAFDLLKRLGRQSLVARHIRDAPCAASQDGPRPAARVPADDASPSPHAFSP
jgi:hypothetical protein